MNLKKLGVYALLFATTAFGACKKGSEGGGTNPTPTPPVNPPTENPVQNGWTYNNIVRNYDEGGVNTKDGKVVNMTLTEVVKKETFTATNGGASSIEWHNVNSNTAGFKDFSSKKGSTMTLKANAADATSVNDTTGRVYAEVITITDAANKKADRVLAFLRYRADITSNTEFTGTPTNFNKMSKSNDIKYEFRYGQ